MAAAVLPPCGYDDVAGVAAEAAGVEAASAALGRAAHVVGAVAAVLVDAAAVGGVGAGDGVHGAVAVGSCDLKFVSS